MGDFAFEISFASEMEEGPLVSYQISSGAVDDFRLYYTGTGITFETDQVGTFLSGPEYTDLFDGTRHTLGFTVDSSRGDWTVFVDGVAVDSGNDIGFENFQFTGGGALVFGQEQDAPNGGFNAGQVFAGTIYDARFWDKTVSEEDLAPFVDQKITPNQPSLSLIHI